MAAIDVAFNFQEGIQQLGPGTLAFGSVGSYGNILVSDLYGKFGELTRRGLVFSANTAAAAAVPINTTLTNAPSLWNPTSSGKLVIPLRIALSVGAIGTPILQGFTLSYLLNTGDVVATGAPIATWTPVAAVNTLLGKGITPRASFAPAVSTYTVNPALLVNLGFGHFLEGAGATGQLYSMYYADLDGQIVMPPGTSIHFGSTIATSMTFWTSILFAELPMPNVVQ
jgi:hypothetical protein